MAGLSEEKFIELLEQYRHEFYRYTCKMVWNPSAVDDVFAGAVAVAWEKRGKFREGSNFRAWVYRIITNKCYVANRETKRHGIDIDEIDEARFATDPEQERFLFEDPEDLFEVIGDELRDALNELSTAQKSCLLLLTFEKYSYKEIAEILDMPVGTVMTHLSRGRTRLRRLLAEYARKSGVVGEDNKYVKRYAPEQDRRAGNER